MAEHNENDLNPQDVHPDEVTDSFALPGVPDSFQRLWTPQRLAYQPGIENGCPFCEMPKLDDEDALIVYRGKTCFVILNLYPYNAGHLLVCAYRHIDMYYKLTQEETLEMAELTQHAMKALNKVSRAAGFNLGMNQGAVGGAGVAEHIHQHVIPRWRGDSNFLPIIAQTRTVARLHSEVRQSLADVWDEVE
ncbi:MAG: HIT domain-containing protein [Micrococcaceae bacterium]